MFQRTLRGLVLLCLVILVSGSPRNYSGNQQERNRRHASCPSCSRDCPDALANWYSMPSRKEFHGLGQQVSPPATIQPYQPSLSFYPSPSPYDGAFRSREAPFEASRDTCKRENPFAYQRRFDSDVAPASPTPIYGTGSSVTSYQSPVDRALGRTPFQRSSFYDVVRPQSDLTPTNVYSTYQSPENVPSIETIRSPYEDSRKVQVVYRADRYPDDSVEENVDAPFEYPGGPMYSDRNGAGLQLQENVERGCLESKMDQFGNSMGFPQMANMNTNVYQSQMGQDLQGDSLKSVNYNTGYQAQPIVTDQRTGINVYQDQRGQGYGGDSMKSVNYNTGYQAQPVVTDQHTGVNVYQDQRGQGYEGDSPKSVNYNTRYQVPPVDTDPIMTVNTNVYQGQRGQQLEGDSPKSVNYNTRYQAQPVGADEVMIVNGHTCQSQGGQQLGGDALKSVNYNPRYQARAIKVADNSEKGDDKPDLRHDLQQDLKERRDAVGGQSISKKTEKPTNASTETISQDKVIESAPQENRSQISIEKMKA